MEYIRDTLCLEDPPVPINPKKGTYFEYKGESFVTLYNCIIDTYGIYKVDEDWLELVELEIKFISSSFNRLGSIDEILYLFNCSTSSNAINKSSKLSLLLIPKSPTLIPHKTISFIPFLVISLILSIVF